MEPMLMTLDAEDDEVEAWMRRGVKSCVRVKTRWRLRVRSLVQAWSGCVSKDSPHAAPLLLMSTWRPVPEGPPSWVVSSAARAWTASRDWRSAGRDRADPPEDLPGCVCQRSLLLARVGGGGK